MADEFKIEKGVPIPKARNGNRVSPYPFAQLAVGESFVITQPTLTSHGAGGLCGGLCTYWSRKLGRKFIQRKVEGGVRVWRIE